MTLSLPARTHGGPDAQGAALHDFSVNSNACGACPAALQALQQADSTRYPDPSYHALRQRLATWHEVDAKRIVLAASASEFILRITAWAAQRGARQVHVPLHAYGDYTHAARCWRLPVRTAQDAPAMAANDLLWLCNPGSPLGQNATPPEAVAAHAHTVLDCAYAPLRLQSTPALPAPLREQVWQMWTPNKALGLAGIRAAYAIAPLHAQAEAAALDALAPSWVLGAHGVALLHAWTQPATQTWLAQSLVTLHRWKSHQITLLTQHGWTCQPSVTNFFCAQPAQPLDEPALACLSRHGIRLRDCASFGLPGWWRMAALPPAAQSALQQALCAIEEHAHAP